MRFSGYKITVQATTAIVSTDEMAEYLNYAVVADLTTADTTLMTQMIESATELIETMANRSFIDRTAVQTYEGFLADCDLEVLAPPLSSVTSITYFDGDNSEQTIDSADYVVDTISQPGSIRVINSWPTTYTGSKVTVTHVAGFGATVDLVPSAAKILCKMIVADNWEHRESQSELRLMDNATTKALWSSLKIKDIY